jgi:hypothetical protein
MFGPSEYRNLAPGGTDLAMGTIWRCDTIGPLSICGHLVYRVEVNVRE